MSNVTPEQALRTKALAHAGVSALIGSRWYAEAARTRGIEYPLVICDVEQSGAVGGLGGNTGWTVDRIALYIYTDGVEGPDGHDDVKAIAEQLRLALHGKKQSVTVGSDTVKPSILLLSEEPASRLKEDGSEDMVYGLKQTYSVSMAQATS